MSTWRESITVAAGATNVNVLSGSKFEFLNRGAVVRLYAAAEESGAAQGTGIIDFTLGNVVVGEDLQIPEKIAANGTTGPDRNTDLVTRGVGAAGDRIQIRIQETGGAQAVVTRVLVDIDEIA